jgi:transcriptional regulator with XRE-family HTH domain
MNKQACKLDTSKKTAILVRALRNMFGLSQNDLSLCAKIARPTISRFEKLDTDGIRADTLEKSLDFFRKQGVELSFNDAGVTIHLPVRTLVKACVLIQDNTLPRGSSSETEDAPLVIRDRSETRYSRRDSETLIEFIERLDWELDYDKTRL